MSSPVHDQDQDDEEEEDQESQQHSLHQPLLLYQNHGNNYNNNLQYHLPNATSQVALVGSNVCPIERLDYEYNNHFNLLGSFVFVIIENDFFKQNWRTRGKTQMYQYLFMKWALRFLVGLMLSLVGFFVNLAIENVAGMKFVFTSNMILARRYALAFLLFTASKMALILFASSITSLIAPAAAGSGIPEVKAYWNGFDGPAIFSPKTL
ncbi:putative chloride channel-like protein [Drosera capensis]